MLTLEMELLTGVYRASLLDQSAAEWPPHPERVFSALVQAWGDGGERDDERNALEWLEALPSPPSIEAVPPSHKMPERDAPIVYVPPNDAKSNALTILPELRNRQERSFRAVVPLETLQDSPAHVRFRWGESAPAEHLTALRALVHRVASVGHSSSLVRLAFLEDGPAAAPELTLEPAADGKHALRVAYAGRLQHLVEWYSTDGKPRERPKTRATVRYRFATPDTHRASVPHSHFGATDSDWIVLEERIRDRDAGQSTPDVLAFPVIARRVRDALMSADPNGSPEMICGHKPDRSPSETPHLAIVPMANVRWRRADGALLGVGLVLPREATAEERRAVMRAVTAWTRDRMGILRIARDRNWRLERVIYAERSSLRRDDYCATASVWASVTPVCLDRFPRGTSPTEEAEILARACTNIGLPEPRAIEIHKHSAIRGAESAYPARGDKRRPEWRFPASARYRDKPRRHVVVRFDKEVSGPILLGAGRYHGLGLCLPLGPRDEDPRLRRKR